MMKLVFYEVNIKIYNPNENKNKCIKTNELYNAYIIEILKKICLKYRIITIIVIKKIENIFYN